MLSFYLSVCLSARLLNKLLTDCDFLKGLLRNLVKRYVYQFTLAKKCFLNVQILTKIFNFFCTPGPHLVFEYPTVKVRRPPVQKKFHHNLWMKFFLKG